MELERLQKVMANCGVDSRRNCEEIIKAKRVKVNGVLVTELGFKVSKKDVITVDGKIVEQKINNIYYLLNKPQGYSLRKNDTRNIYDIVLDSKSLNPLLKMSGKDSGALILTNDGKLKNKFQKSKNFIEFKYEVRIVGQITQKLINLFKKGINFNGNIYKLNYLKLIDYDKEHNSSYFSFNIVMSKSDNILDLFKSINVEVKKIKRVSIDIVSIDGLVEGAYRELKPHEIKKLYSL